MSVKYVRFQRGVQAAYDLLKSQGKLDENTLYFIYDETNNGTGSLYMGERIISGGDITFTSASLDQLSDVIVANAETNSFLVKGEDGNWIAKTPNEVAELIQNYINIEQQPSLEGDNLSIEIIDNVIQLKNYGTNYYAYVPAQVDENGVILTESSYVLTEGFKEGLEPRVITDTNGVLSIAWYEPNTEQIDNLKESVEQIQSDVENLSSNITDINSNISEIEELLNSENGLVDRVGNLEEIIGNAADENTEATGFYKELENISNELDSKANASDVYTKTETETAISTAIINANHLQRKIVDSIDDIDTAAADADLYIYMVPTGLQYEDDKYDEYVVIDNVVEKVGSWEVDLSKYATKDEVAEKADKATTLAGYGITDTYTKTEITELIADITGGESAADVKAELAEFKTNTNTALQNIQTELNSLQGAEPNYIKSVDAKNFSVSDEGNLSLVSVEISQVNGLQEIINNNTVTSEEKSALQDVVAGKFDNYIKSVTSDFEVSEEGQLQLVNVSRDALKAVVGDVTTLIDFTEGTTIVSEINEIKQLLIWQEMTVESTT